MHDCPTLFSEYPLKLLASAQLALMTLAQIAEAQKLTREWKPKRDRSDSPQHRNSGREQL